MLDLYEIACKAWLWTFFWVTHLFPFDQLRCPDIPGFKFQRSETSTTLELRVIDEWWYVGTNVSFGTPPQNFTAILDLTGSDTFVPSIACLEPHCRSQRVYNVSASSTFRRAGKMANVSYWGDKMHGEVTRDIMRIGDLMIPGQTFLDVKGDFGRLGEEVESVLGLAREGKGALGDGSVFQNLDGVMEEHVFTMTLPRNTTETGSLILGESPDLSETSTSALLIPLQPVSKPSRNEDDERRVPSGGWPVGAHAVSFGTGLGDLHADLNSHRVVFSTAIPFIGLPDRFISAVQTALNISDPWSVPCDLPAAKSHNLTMFFKGKDDEPVPVVLTPEDWLVDNLFQWPGDEDCMLSLLPADEPEGDEEMVGDVVLGLLFSSKFRSVFKADEMMVMLLEREE